MTLGDALDAPEAATRAQRLATIGAPAPPVVDPHMLVKALGDDDPSVRKEAVRLCERWRGAPVVFVALERALRDEESLSRRSSAMDAYGLLGAVSVPPLARLYEADKPGLRRIAVDSLGLTRAREAVPPLLRATKDQVPSIRTAALEALVEIGAPEAPVALAEVIGDPKEPASVVLAALLGMVGLGEAVAPALLLRHLDDALTAPPALRLLGRAGQAEPLVKVLASSTGSRQRAAVVGLMEALERDPENARALGTIGASELAAALRRHVEQGDAAVASAALFVAAHAGLVDLFVAAAARRDRQLLASAAHKAAAVLARSVPGAADILDAAVQVDAEAPGNEMLSELADAVRRRRAASIERRAHAPLLSRSSTAKLSDLQLLRIAQIFEREAGLSIQLDARERIEARLAPRVEASGVSSFDEYVTLLDAKPTARGDSRRELMKALELVTVHETYFFRERAQLDAFRREVLPVLERQKRADQTLRVWSAGCSSGEEAWTLGIMLSQAGLSMPFEIVGTDLSETSIAQARTAKYSPKSFRGDIDPDTRRRSFVYELGGVSVHPSLRSGVRFELVNLMDEAAVRRLGRFDAILCRNVLIYMSREARMDVVASFYERLVPGGALFLGHSESLLHVDTPFRLLPLTRELCWTRPEVGAAFREVKPR